MGTFRLRDFALTSCSADINARYIRWNSSSVLHGVGRSIIKGKSADYHYKNCSFWLKSACLYHFFAATQKDFALFLYLCTRIRQIKSKIIKSYTEMNLNMHITSQSFVQSYRRFERNNYVHTSSTSDTAGIGFPHHYSHSYFYRAS